MIELSLRDEKLKDLREDLTKAEAKVETIREKITSLEAEQKNAAKYDGIVVGSVVQYVYGRGDKKRTLTGTVKAVGNDGGTVKLLVESGEGLDIALNKIDRSTVVFDDNADVPETDPVDDALTGTV